MIGVGVQSCKIVFLKKNSLLTFQTHKLSRPMYRSATMYKRERHFYAIQYLTNEGSTYNHEGLKGQLPPKISSYPLLQKTNHSYHTIKQPSFYDMHSNVSSYPLPPNVFVPENPFPKCSNWLRARTNDRVETDIRTSKLLSCGFLGLWTCTWTGVVWSSR